jgi:hypothetical protein
MKILFVLWGTAKDAQSWEEEIIIETRNREVLEKTRTWANADGFQNVRVLETFDGDKPIF